MEGNEFASHVSCVEVGGVGRSGEAREARTRWEKVEAVGSASAGAAGLVLGVLSLSSGVGEVEGARASCGKRSLSPATSLLLNLTR